QAVRARCSAAEGSCRRRRLSRIPMNTTPAPAEEIVLGKLVSVLGVGGEVKVQSFTDPIDILLDYWHGRLRRGDEVRQVELVKGRPHGKVLVVKLKGLDDPDEARLLAEFEGRVPRSELPELSEGEYYWYQLEGLKVINQEGQLLGQVDHLLETGSNDVMVVKPCAGSLD